uniref:Uncharacterized protein n=2 Tax=Caenorhabditis japonica TaxID=281687 RepID=A0A8R1EAR7_CAEJA
MQIPKNNYLLTEKMRIPARGEAFENFMNGLAQKLLNMNDEEDSVIRDIEQLLNYKSELCGKLHEAELVTLSLRPTSEELDTLQKLERVKDSLTGHYIRVDFLYSNRRKIYNQIQTTSEAALWDLEQAITIVFYAVDYIRTYKIFIDPIPRSRSTGR